MEKSDIHIANFINRIVKQPALLKRFEQLLCIVEDSAGNIQKASEAEMRVMQELREMGHEVLTAWGERQVSTLTEQHKNIDGCHQVGKKTLVAYDLWTSRRNRSFISARTSNPTSLF
jgi:hypothetical protein